MKLDKLNELYWWSARYTLHTAHVLLYQMHTMCKCGLIGILSFNAS